MRLLLTGLGLVISLASIAMGLASLLIIRPAGVALSEENIALIIIAGSFAFLGSLSTRKQAGVAAILEIFAGSLGVVAAEPGHGYVYVYAGAMVLLGVATMLFATSPQRRQSAVPAPPAVLGIRQPVQPSPRHLRARARRHRTRSGSARRGVPGIRRQVRARLRRAVGKPIEAPESLSGTSSVSAGPELGVTVEADPVESGNDGEPPADAEHDDGRRDERKAHPDTG